MDEEPHKEALSQLGDGMVQDLREVVANMDHPLKTDQSPFSVWLRKQVSRNDAVGALARVALQDPGWPSSPATASMTEVRKKLKAYFRKMGARVFVLDSLDAAWTEFDKDVKRTANRTKGKQQKAARKKNRRRK